MADEGSIGASNDIRPQVSLRKGNAAVWLFALALVAASGGIFYGLQMRRIGLKDEPLVPQTETGGMISSPPPLVIPQNLVSPTMGPGTDSYLAAPPPMVSGGQPQAYPPMRQSASARVLQSPEPPYSYAPASTSPTPAQMGSDGVVFQPSSSSGPSPAGKTEESANAGVARIRSGRLQDPSSTVPQGSVIQAVMETALDSTRAGFARAIVSRDVMSFDGSRILIPRGSKLVGEYKADVSLGQKRALVQWHRMTLPDGAIIDVDSPAADPLGRAGIKGKVNTHFFERFSGAILQSVLDVGVRAATSEATNNTVIIGTPTSTQTALSSQQNSIQPTLKIKQGASVTVFVARDLVFL